MSMFRNEFLHAFDFRILLQNQKIILTPKMPTANKGDCKRKI